MYNQLLILILNFGNTNFKTIDIMNTNPVFSLNIPTKLMFGCGEIKNLATEQLPGKKAMIVISAGSSMRK